MRAALWIVFGVLFGLAQIVFISIAVHYLSNAGPMASWAIATCTVLVPAGVMLLHSKVSIDFLYRHPVVTKALAITQSSIWQAANLILSVVGCWRYLSN